MPKCSFCSEHYEFPRGLTLVLPDGRILYFCSSKCRKNYELGRVGKKMKWVSKKKKGKKPEVAQEKIEAEKAEEKAEKQEKAEVAEKKENQEQEKAEENKQKKDK